MAQMIRLHFRSGVRKAEMNAKASDRHDKNLDRMTHGQVDTTPTADALDGYKQRPVKRIQVWRRK